jgi:predicted DNA-binding antitoxin AbrB/MazE fold protein
VRPIQALYEGGLLKPEEPLPLVPGERVRVLVLREPDPSRWDHQRLESAAAGEETELTKAGLEAWLDQLDAEDKR